MREVSDGDWVRRYNTPHNIPFNCSNYLFSKKSEDVQ